MTTALATLTATYTDSEGEENHEHEDGSPMATEQSPQVEAPIIENIAVTPSKPKSANLVSYHDDTAISDDEPVTQSPVEEKKIITCEDDVELPPEPQGRCSQELQDKIRKLYDDMLSKGLDMNAMIHQKKEFRNPSIYEKLIQFCGINELGTNYRPDVYDPLRWSKSSFYDELAKVQKADMDARDKERKERTKVEVISGTAKKPAVGVTTVVDEERKRRTKWDQVGKSSHLTTTSSGTKGTVISAFGSLNKKPRL